MLCYVILCYVMLKYFSVINEQFQFTITVPKKEQDDISITFVVYRDILSLISLSLLSLLPSLFLHTTHCKSEIDIIINSTANVTIIIIHTYIYLHIHTYSDTHICRNVFHC